MVTLAAGAAVVIITAGPTAEGRTQREVNYLKVGGEGWLYPLTSGPRRQGVVPINTLSTPD